MSVLDTAKAHYQEILAVDPKPLTIPEWGGEFFVRPQISVKKKMEIQSKLTGNKMDEGIALSLVYYLIDGAGNPIFSKGDLFEMLRAVDPDTLIRVAGEIAELQPKSEDLEGN